MRKRAYFGLPIRQAEEPIMELDRKSALATKALTGQALIVSHGWCMA